MPTETAAKEHMISTLQSPADYIWQNKKRVEPCISPKAHTFFSGEGIPKHQPKDKLINYDIYFGLRVNRMDCMFGWASLAIVHPIREGIHLV